MKAIFEVYATNEFASDFPSVFVIEFTDALITNIEGLEAKCVDGIIRIAADSDEGVWGSEETEEALRLYSHELVVNKDGGVSFQAVLKDTDWHIETMEAGIATLRSDFEAGEKVVFYGADEEYLKELYEAHRVVTAA